MDKSLCTIAPCDRTSWARGLCSTHYQRWRTTGDAGLTAIRPTQSRDGACSVAGCDRDRSCAGYCGTHYRRVRTHGTPGSAEIGIYRAGPCYVEGCDSKTVGRGLCRMHYERQRKGRPVGDAKPQRRTAGEGAFSNGYHLVTVSRGKTRPRHRVLMEALLGRALLRTETVHHVNGNRSDNTITDQLDERFRSGNLELWSTWQPAGQRVADKVEYAEALLREYAPHLLVNPTESAPETRQSAD